MLVNRWCPRIVAPAALWALAGLFSGCGPAADATGAPSAAETAEAPVTVTVAPVEVRSTTLFGFEVVTITPKVEGRVNALKVEVGDRVAPGETLLELDPSNYVLAVDEAKRSLELELSRLDLTGLPGPDFDIEKLPAVERARLVVENAKRQPGEGDHRRTGTVAAADAAGHTGGLLALG